MTQRTTGQTTKQGAAEEPTLDLRGTPGPGFNAGVAGGHPGKDGATAYDHKLAHDRLGSFTDDELKQITVVPEGSRLEQGATYLDLLDPTGAEFTARGDQEAGPDHLYVAKNEVDHELWNRLRGVDDPARTRDVEKGT